ncbi:MAG: hypothetical protein D6743_17555 [Calditrichaeota bacterium]|nr:MAG: hypothetical protein D6743_17555 [Calditrichota bacterium]
MKVYNQHGLRRLLTNLSLYFRPKSISEALALLQKNSGSVLVIAGGTKLVRAENHVVRELVDISGLGLNQINLEAGLLRIGATVTVQELVDASEIQAFADGIISEAAQLTHHSRQVRNASTVGGELATTGPLSPLYCALLVLQAQVRIAGGEEFALAMNIFKNKKEVSGGLLLEVLVPETAPHCSAALAAAGERVGQPAICACARLTLQKGRCEEVKLAISGTAPVPQRLHEVETFLTGKKVTANTLDEVADRVTALYQPISDALASQTFRREASRFVVKKALQECLDRAESTLL